MIDRRFSSWAQSVGDYRRKIVSVLAARLLPLEQCEGDGMGPLVSLELRWFYPVDRSDALAAWFAGLPGAEISPLDERDDIYLHQAGADALGVKLRLKTPGTPYALELKWRELAKPYSGPHGVSGQVERWLKWDWEDPNGPSLEAIQRWAMPRGPWLTIGKTRLQRKYAWNSRGLEPVHYKQIVDLGAAVELTQLRAGSKRQTTVLVESFAADVPTQQTILDAAVGAFWRDFPSPRPSQRNSFGYPRWLSETHQQNGGEQ
jgi:hypothetical protein